MENVNDLSYIKGFYRGRAEGEIIAEERIIEILEKSGSTCAYWAIALIKGETK